VEGVNASCREAGGGRRPAPPQYFPEAGRQRVQRFGFGSIGRKFARLATVRG